MFLTDGTDNTEDCSPYLSDLLCKSSKVFYLVEMDINVLSYKIRDSIFSVHKALGPGLLESVYVIVDIKSIEAIHDVHKKQLMTYLKLSEKKLGILVNFNVMKLVDKESLIRIIN